MTGLVFRPIGPVGNDLVVLDANRRLYIGLSHDGAAWHSVHPTPIDLVNGDGATIRTAGQLVCTCKGSAFRGTCWRVKQAEAFEAGQPGTAFTDSPWGAGELVEASRG